MNTRNLTVALLAVGTLAGVTGCGDSGAGATPVATPTSTWAVPTVAPSSASGVPSSVVSSSAASTPATSTAASSTSRPSASSLGQADEAAAQAAYQAWRKAMDAYSEAPEKPATDLSKVASGEGLTQSEQILASMKSQKVRTQGSTVVASQQVVQSADAQSHPIVRLRVCEDASKVKVLDAKGKEIPLTGTGRYRSDYIITRDGGQWKVNYIDSKGTAC